MTYIALILAMLAASASTTAVHEKSEVKQYIYGIIAAVSAIVVATGLGG